MHLMVSEGLFFPVVFLYIPHITGLAPLQVQTGITSQDGPGVAVQHATSSSYRDVDVFFSSFSVLWPLVRKTASVALVLLVRIWASHQPLKYVPPADAFLLKNCSVHLIKSVTTHNPTSE